MTAEKTDRRRKSEEERKVSKSLTLDPDIVEKVTEFAEKNNNTKFSIVINEVLRHFFENEQVLSPKIFTIDKEDEDSILVPTEVYLKINNIQITTLHRRVANKEVKKYGKFVVIKKDDPLNCFYTVASISERNEKLEKEVLDLEKRISELEKK